MLIKRLLLTILITLFLYLPCDARQGYKIYISNTSGDYSSSTPIDCGLVQLRVVKGLTPGNYYAVATAYKNTEESGYSNEVSFTISDEPSVTFLWDPSPQVPVPKSIFWW
jgi:hypothetical protein